MGTLTLPYEAMGQAENGAGRLVASLNKEWQRVKFGDAVVNVNANESNPLDKGLDRYVGLDHLDPEDLRLKRWGNVADGITFTRVFRTGQVLFGKRRAYQRKVAVADFDGICSGDILVFEAKSDILLPDLLPFIVQSEGFFQHALGTSAGSLSPRTKWAELAKFEFALPPIDEQRRIAEILWAVEESLVAWQLAEDNSTKLWRRMLSRFTQIELSTDSSEQTSTSSSQPWRTVQLGKLLSHCQYGLSMPMKSNGQYPIFRMMNLEDGVVVDNDMKYVDLSDSEFQAYRVQGGDILFNRTNSIDLVGKLGIFRLTGDYVYASYLICLRADTESILPEFLNYYLNSDEGQKQIVSHATLGVSQANINASNLKLISVPLPPIDTQRKIIGILSATAKSRKDMLSHKMTLVTVKQHLMVELLSQ